MLCAFSAMTRSGNPLEVLGRTTDRNIYDLYLTEPVRYSQGGIYMRPSVPVAGSATHSRAATSTQTHGPPSTGPRAPCTPRRAIRANSAWGARRASCHELPLARMLPQLPRRRRRAFPPASLRSSLTCGWYSRSGARRQRLNAAIHLSVHALETVQGFGGVTARNGYLSSLPSWP